MSDDVELKRSVCMFCVSVCGIQVQVKDGEVVKVESDKNFRSPGPGFRCEKNVLASLDYHDHPNRLNYPLKRAGARGEGKWQRVSWEQALDEVAGKLADIRSDYGPEAAAMLVGIGGTRQCDAMVRWANLFGTPNIFDSTKNCYQPQIVTEVAVYGGDTVPEMGRPGVTKCAVVFGANPFAAFPSAWSHFLELKRGGAKIIVIDPRRTKTAEQADIWLQLKPGTDGALAYGMLNVIIEEGLYDKEFVDKWCLGFDEVREFIKAYPPRVVEDITWVPAEKIAEVARIYATSAPASMATCWGVTHSQLGRGRTLSVNLAKCIMRAITGNLDVKGGDVLVSPLNYAHDQNMHFDKIFEHPLRTRDKVDADIFPIMSLRALKLFHKALHKVYGENGYSKPMALYPNVSPRPLWDAIINEEPYPVKALLNFGMNVLVTRTNYKRVYQALKSDKLALHITADHYLTPSAMLSDYVFPITDMFEKPYMDPEGYYRSIGEQAVKPKYERRNDYDLCRGLGIRLGQEAYWPETLEAFYSKYLEPTGLSFQETVRTVRWVGDQRSLRPPRKYKQYEESGFATLSGKVELLPSILKELGYKLLPHYSDLPQIPGVTGSPEDYPLILIAGGRVRTFNHSCLREQPRLRERHPDPIMQLHPDTAKEHGISSGDWVYIETPKGKIKQRAELTDGIHPKVVHAEHGWWFPERSGEDPYLFGVWESGVGQLFPDEPETCDFQGGVTMRAVQCKISKV